MFLLVTIDVNAIMSIFLDIINSADNASASNSSKHNHPSDIDFMPKANAIKRVIPIYQYQKRIKYLWAV